MLSISRPEDGSKQPPFLTNSTLAEPKGVPNWSEHVVLVIWDIGSVQLISSNMLWIELQPVTCST